MRRGGTGRVGLALLVLAVMAGCTGGPGAADRRTGSGTGDQPVRAVTGRTTARGGEPVLGAKWDWGRADRFAPYLRRVPGGGATFYELVWCDVEPRQGRVDWTRSDQVVRSARQLGYSMYLKLRVGSCWATGGQAGARRGGKGKTASAMPADPAAYQAWMRAAVRRYAPMGVREYAIENEVNGQGFWAASPADYQRLAMLASAAIHRADPRALVVDAGISSTAYGVAIADKLLRRGRDAEAVAAYQRYYQRRFDRRGRDFPEVGDPAELRIALGGQQARRNLAFMAVANQLAERKVVDVRQLHFYESWDNLPAVLAYLGGALPAGFPVQAWEVGMFWPKGSAADATPNAAEATPNAAEATPTAGEAPTGQATPAAGQGAPTGEQARADELAKAVSLLLAGGVRPVIWLPLAFDPAGRHADEPRYGLLDPGGAVRPAGAAFLQLATMAAGASSWQGIARGDVTGVAFSHGSSTSMVVWSQRGGTLQLAPRPAGHAELLGGGRVPWGAEGIAVGADPLLVTTGAA